MQERFDRILKELLPEGEAALLAVSGGVDSMCLADLFLNSSLHPDFAVAHCDFHLRGEDSLADEALVREWAESHGRIFIKKDFDTLGYATEKGVSVEMAARELRYAWFGEVCRGRGISFLAVAHNANDNAETLILNLLRGTGVRGACGMRTASPLSGAPGVTILRPLLGFPRKEISEYAVSRGLHWREDRTNADSSYKRNRIRNEIFPLFEKLNPSFLNTLGEDMERFAQVQAVADDFIEAVENEAVTRSGEGLPEIDFQRLMARRNWEYALFRILEPYGFTASAAGDVADLLKKGGTVSGKRFYSNEYLAVTGGRSIALVRRERSETSDGQEVLVTGPGEYSLKGVRFSVAEDGDASVVKTAPGETRFDSSAVPFPFIVRGWRPGDWMRPLGLKGSKKLSDLFVDLKMGVPDKEKALVIAGEGSHVLSLVGHRIDDSIKVTGRTASVTIIRIL